ncbi:MAG: ribosome recycling factor [Candidatus Amesbacteria bacterium GW2011_GWB1_47_19]|nr:MAG: ribosome recycling factor [Candidatus Amesbacteria bacterium GW2011_GWA1_44_24]KKU31448.1 MAG: ribosome recycling factor [Candidatus Amesbacteria bacterium GW2011_GWC1_46_24]KKU67456.1 MAG: ribosome recycling factor [Candidatus Amesbacteria bacterium GW2011_GWB1_47_19]
MAKVLEFVKQDVATIRTGRAAPALVENVIIKAYGGSTRLKVVELGTVNVPDAQSLVITPYDNSIIGDIRRDIEAANLGLTPIIDNNVIRIAIPPLTSERRLEYVKMLHRKLEEGRVKVRQIRHDKMAELKRAHEAGDLPEDDKFTVEEELQKVTDEMMDKIEEIGQAKEAELTGS